MAKQYLFRKDVAEMLRCSEQSVDRWSRNPDMDFPAPFYIGVKPVWDRDTIDAFLDRKHEEANEKK